MKSKLKITIACAAASLLFPAVLSLFLCLLGGFGFSKFWRGFLSLFIMFGGPSFCMAVFYFFGWCIDAEAPCSFVLWYGTVAIGVLIANNWKGSDAMPYIIGFVIAALCCGPTARIARKITRQGQGRR